MLLPVGHYTGLLFIAMVANKEFVTMMISHYYFLFCTNSYFHLPVVTSIQIQNGAS